MNQPIPVSIVIPVRNEEANLDRCLAALKRFDDVIILDSASVDRTCDIALEHGARVLQFLWDGRYPKKRNWFLLNHTPRYPWVLFLDADEFVTEEFCSALLRAIEKTDHVGFWLNYSTYFLGKRLKYGIAQRKLALFRVGAGLYERIDEDRWSNLDMEVHEHPVLSGTVGEIAAPIDHRDDRGIVKFIDRHRDYAQWEARRYHRIHSDGLTIVSMTRRQKIKYKYIKYWWYPFAYGAAQYILKRGIFDGYAGFSYAFYKIWYFYTVRLLIASMEISHLHGRKNAP